MLRLIFLCTVALATVPLVAGDGGEVVVPVFQSHCIQCHGQDGKVKGKVNLLEIEDGGASPTAPARWAR